MFEIIREIAMYITHMTMVGIVVVIIIEAIIEWTRLIRKIFKKSKQTSTPLRRYQGHGLDLWLLLTERKNKTKMNVENGNVKICVSDNMGSIVINLGVLPLSEDRVQEIEGRIGRRLLFEDMVWMSVCRGEYDYDQLRNSGIPLDDFC